MLPVYRARDKVGNLVEKNAAVFDEAHRRIAVGNVISLFPEGNHNNQKWLRPLRKGASRVTVGALEELQFSETVKIVPVGIDYSNYTDFQSDILITFGEPISALEYAESYKQEPAKTLGLITKRISEELRKRVITIDDQENYATLKRLLPLCVDSLTTKKERRKHINRLTASQKALTTITELEENGNGFADKAKRYLNLIDELGLDETSVQHPTRFWNELWRFIGLPILAIPLIIGLALNVVPAILVTSFVKNKIKDPHFTSSITLALGILVFPIFWLFEAILIWLISSNLTLAGLSLIAAPVCGLIAARLWRREKEAEKQAKIKRAKRKNYDKFMKMVGLKNELQAALVR